MRRGLPLLAVASILFAGLTARAESYVVTINGSNLSGSLNLTGSVDPLGDPGAIHLTSGTGVINGQNVTLVPSPLGTTLAHFYNDPNSGIGFSGELYPNSPNLFDAAGIELTNGAQVGLTFWVPYFDATAGGANVFQFFSPTRTGVNFPVTFSLFSVTPNVGAAPEPSSMVLLGTGLVALAGAARRKLTARA